MKRHKTLQNLMSLFFLTLIVLSSTGCKKDKDSEQETDQTVALDEQSAATKSSSELNEVSISNASVTEGNEGSTSLKLTVSCSAEPRKNRDVTVKWSTSDATGTSEAQATAGEDYTASNGILTFKKGGSLQQQIIVPVKSDVDMEEDELFLVTLEQPVNATIANGVGEALIVNDDKNTSSPDKNVIVDHFSDFSRNDSDGNALYNEVSVQHAEFKEVLQVEIKTKPSSDDRINLAIDSPVQLHQDDMILISFYARAINSSESGSGQLEVLFQNNSEPQPEYISWPISISTEWKKYSVPFSVQVWRSMLSTPSPTGGGDSTTFGVAEVRFRLDLGYYPQVIQLADTSIVNYGASTSWDELPCTLSGKNYMLISRERLEALPTSDTAWDYLKEKADQAVAVTLDASSEGSPWLTNYNDKDGIRLTAKYLAAALVYASNYAGDKAPYRQAVENALRHIIGSEEELSTDGTALEDAMLSTARQLAGWILAADLIGFDASLTGTRTSPGRTSGTDWTKVTFREWLSTIMTKKIGTNSRWNTITGTQEDSASNWSAQCTASRIAVALYLGNCPELSRAVTIMKGFLGDSASYPTLPSGTAGAGFLPTGPFDPSWACRYSEVIGGWHPINPKGCAGDGTLMDGIVVEDISRSAAGFPNWDKTGISYTYETLQGLYLAAILLERTGQHAFSWGDQALKRAMQWLDRQGQIPSINNYGCERHVPWVANYFYGTHFPTQPANVCRSLGFTDWLFP